MDASEDGIFAEIVKQVHGAAQSFKTECDRMYKSYLDIHHDSLSQRDEIRRIRETSILENFKLLAKAGTDLGHTLNSLKGHIEEDRLDDLAQIRMVNSSIQIHRDGVNVIKRITKEMVHLIEFQG